MFCPSGVGTRTAERANNACVRACVLACVTDGDGSELAVAGNRAGPTTPNGWVAVNQGPGSRCASYGVNPWTSLEETAARALWARSEAQTLVCLDTPLGPAPRSIVPCTIVWQ